MYQRQDKRYDKYYDWVDSAQQVLIIRPELPHINNVSGVYGDKSQFAEYILELASVYNLQQQRDTSLDLKIFAYLLQQGADVNVIIEHATIIQHLLPYTSLVSGIIEQIGYIPNPEFVNANGDTAFLLACKLLSPLIYKLQESGCDINATDCTGANALHLVVKYTLINNDSTGIHYIKYLLKYLDVNHVDFYGNTCLYYLEFTPYDNIQLGVDICSLLLDANINLHSRNNIDMTVHDLLSYRPDLSYINNLLL